MTRKARFQEFGLPQRREFDQKSMIPKITDSQNADLSNSTMHIAAKHPAADARIQYHSLLGSIKRIARLHLATPEFAYDLKVLAFFERERE